MRLHVPVPVRWSDLDAYQHVNNVEMLRLLEEARITAFWSHPGAGEEAWPTAVLGSGPDSDTHTVVARQEIEYLRPLAFTRTPVRVETWIGKLGGASLEICYEVYEAGSDFGPRVGPHRGGEPRAVASSTIVVVDASTGRPRRVTPSEQAAWRPFIGEPVSFRHRRR